MTIGIKFWSILFDYKEILSADEWEWLSWKIIALQILFKQIYFLLKNFYDHNEDFQKPKKCLKGVSF